MLCLNHGYPGVPIPVSFLTPGTSGSKVPLYPWVPVVTTRGFLTSRVTTCWVLVRTSDFLEVPLPTGKNPCLSLSVAINVFICYLHQSIFCPTCFTWVPAGNTHG